LFLRELRAARKASGLNQREVAERMQETILFVSRCERGERRMDVVELVAFCEAMDKPFVEFAGQLQATLNRKR
jgi:transcriptional regulator with XRE-family HTH domain